MRTITHFLKWSAGLADPITGTTEEERNCLADHASGRKTLVELGVWHGVTTSRLRKAMAKDGVLYAVDPFVPGRLGFSIPHVIARREVSRAPGGKVEWVRKMSTEAVPLFSKRQIEFLFIDAGHGYDDVRSDWENWSGLMASGGIVGLHDSRTSPKRNLDGVGSMVYTQEVVLRDTRFKLADEVDSLTVLRRK